MAGGSEDRRSEDRVPEVRGPEVRRRGPEVRVEDLVSAPPRLCPSIYVVVLEVPGTRYPVPGYTLVLPHILPGTPQLIGWLPADEPSRRGRTSI